ncbi:hypothetical protein [Actinoplanes sp. G11-F43]|uniref:hypothetical protein n=1 Tax=Actinoplanes sp. G11-F43 TaxID=3424130 RepID=UPI003D32816A
MTALPVPSPGSAAWRARYPVPPDLDLECGPWCRLCDAVLVIERHGWLCAQCLAWWDRNGRRGVWVADGPALEGVTVSTVVDLGEQPGPAAARWRRFDLALALTIPAGIVLGLGAAAGRELVQQAEQPLLWAAVFMLAGLLLIGAGLVLAARWWAGHAGGGAR